MQSTFSADVGGEDNKLVFADEDEEIDEDDLDEAATLGQKLVLYDYSKIPYLCFPEFAQNFKFQRLQYINFQYVCVYINIIFAFRVISKLTNGQKGKI